MSGRPYDVLIVGEVNVDIILTGDVVPEFGQVEKLVDDFVLCAGASSAIFASAAAKMGLRVLLASVVGDDLFGHYMIEALRASGVDTSFIRVDRSLKTGAGIHLSKGERPGHADVPGLDRGSRSRLGRPCVVPDSSPPSCSQPVSAHLVAAGHARDDANCSRRGDDRLPGHELGP